MMKTILLFSTLLFSGLVAGLLYSYSCSVNPGLNALSDDEYVKAMQSINTSIQNPFFLTSFIGLLFLFPITTYYLYQQPLKFSFYLFLSAMMIHLIGVIGITFFCNIPLNNQLAKFAVSSSSSDQISVMRKTFEQPWNRFHTIRMLASILSFGLGILATLKQK